MKQEELENALIEVREIYKTLAARPIQRNCIGQTECCQFHITGRTPQLTKGEALLAAKALRATGRRELLEADEENCPLLKTETGRCLIYSDRPFGCRTHFCDTAGGPYSRKDVLDLVRRLEDLDRRLGGDGPRRIQTAVDEALAELNSCFAKRS